MRPAVQVQTSRGTSKKLNTTSASAVHEVGCNFSRRLFVTDQSTRLKYLVDTGADLSILPKSILNNKSVESLSSTPKSYKIFAANGAPIATFGTVILHVNLGLRREFTWNFLVADITKPILGADFLDRYELLVDIRNKQLIDAKTGLRTRCDSYLTQYVRASTIDTNSLCSDLLNDFKDLTLPPTFRTEDNLRKESVKHQIITHGQPVFARARRLNPEKLKIAKSEFEKMIKSGICKPSQSPWASPLHIVPKKMANGAYVVTIEV